MPSRSGVPRAPVGCESGRPRRCTRQGHPVAGVVLLDRVKVAANEGFVLIGTWAWPPFGYARTMARAPARSRKIVAVEWPCSDVPTGASPHQAHPAPGRRGRPRPLPPGPRRRRPGPGRREGPEMTGRARLSARAPVRPAGRGVEHRVVLRPRCSTADHGRRPKSARTRAGRRSLERVAVHPPVPRVPLRHRCNRQG
jgi:hypothetical protein